MKHKHYDVIVAKAANMDLVVFVKTCDNGAWYEKGKNDAFQWWEDSDYFLCLPQHKEACLNWLNGGDVQSLSDGKWFDVLDWSYFWSVNSGFMQDDFTTRIKPKKEKRWIVYRNGTVYGEYLSPESINDDFKNTGQVIEIEVEV